MPQIASKNLIFAVFIMVSSNIVLHFSVSISNQLFQPAFDKCQKADEKVLK